MLLNNDTHISQIINNIILSNCSLSPLGDVTTIVISRENKEIYSNYMNFGKNIYLVSFLHFINRNANRCAVTKWRWRNDSLSREYNCLKIFGR